MTTCKTCQRQFEPLRVPHPFDMNRDIFVATRCPECVKAFAEAEACKLVNERAERKLAKNKAILDALVPAAYKKTDQARLIREHPLTKPVIERPLTKRGLILQGDTGTGKTRAMWELLREYHWAHHSITWLTGPGFDSARKKAEHDFAISEWQDSISEADILFIDDWGKGEWNQACIGVFFEIIERRTSNDLPIFLTTNCNLNDTMLRWKAPYELSKPINRRLVENCDCFLL